jgi:hypothetical protein
MPSSVFGLPAHPLVVHMAVVLVPLAALSLIAVGWNKAWRHTYYLPITLLALGGAVGSFLASFSTRYGWPTDSFGVSEQPRLAEK